MRIWAKRIALIGVSCLVTGVSMEAALRFTPYRYHLSAHDTARFHYKADDETGHDINERGPRFIHHVPQDGFSYELWSNELGCFDEPYRHERDYTLLVGDSFTEYLAPFQDMWGTRIEKRLGHRLLKCGVGGYGTRQQLIKANRIIARVGLPPRVIIVGYYMNDLEDDHMFPAMTVIDGHMIAQQVNDRATGRLTREPRERLEDTVERWEQRCEMPGVPTERFAVLRCFLRRHSIVFGAAKSLWSSGARPAAASTPEEGAYPLTFQSAGKYPWVRTAWTEHLKNLKAFQQLAERLGSQLLVVVIPTREQVEPFLLQAPTIDLELPNRTLQAFFDQERIPCLDLLPDFRRAARSGADRTAARALYWAHNAHFNVAGNHLAALLVARHLLDSGLVAVDHPSETRAGIVDELKAYLSSN